MTVYLLPGLCGLFLGLALQWTGFHRPESLRAILALRRSYALRSGLYALGFAMAATALLCWLAVIDVDTIEVLPLSAGALAGGAVLGVAAGLCGFTPGTAFAGLGGGPALPALCTLAGCLAGTWLLPLLEELFVALRTLGPHSDATLFQVTLDEPFLLDGGFLGQGCAGLLLMVIALCIPSPRMAPLEAVVQQDRLETPGEPELPEEKVRTVEPGPTETKALEEPEAEAPLGDAFVAILPGEEPLVIDTALEELSETVEAEPQEKKRRLCSVRKGERELKYPRNTRTRPDKKCD